MGRSLQYRYVSRRAGSGERGVVLGCATTSGARAWVHTGTQLPTAERMMPNVCGPWGHGKLSSWGPQAAGGSHPSAVRFPITVFRFPIAASPPKPGIAPATRSQYTSYSLIQIYYFMRLWDQAWN